MFLLIQFDRIVKTFRKKILQNEVGRQKLDITDHLRMISVFINIFFMTYFIDALKFENME